MFGRFAANPLVRRGALLACLCLLVGGSLFGAPRSARADEPVGEDGLIDEAAGAAGAVYFWQPASLPALYKFRADGVGLRTTYPTWSLSFGQSFAFAWSLRGDRLVLQFVSGYTDVLQLRGYDRNADILYQVGSGQGDAPLYGCRSGVMPRLIWSQLC